MYIYNRMICIMQRYVRILREALTSIVFSLLDILKMCPSLDLYLARENLADSGPVIIPYGVIDRIFITLYGIITGSLSANYSCARCDEHHSEAVKSVFLFVNLNRK